MLDPDTPAPNTTPPELSERARRNLRLLDDLIGIGMNLARGHERLMEAQVDSAQAFACGDFTDRAPPGGWITVAESRLTFDRITRAIRLCMALQDRLEQGVPIRAEAARRDQAAPDPAGHKATVKRRRGELVAEVAAAAQPRLERGEATDALLCDLIERLDDIDEDDLLNLPTGVLVARIVAAMGLKRDWAYFHDQPEAAPAPSTGASSTGDSLLNSRPAAGGDPPAGSELREPSPVRADAAPVHDPP